MLDCIFTPHCIELVCDKSCPAYVETSYLLERNGININNPVFASDASAISSATEILSKFDGTTGGVIVEPGKLDTLAVSELITYCAICQNWQGSSLHCTVYNLKFSKYLDEMKKSWNSKESENYEYMQIWSETAKVLIISNFDFVNFKDFESQTLLNLIQTRSSSRLTTILISPPARTLLNNNGMFFNLIVSKWLKGNDANSVKYNGGGVK